MSSTVKKYYLFKLTDFTLQPSCLVVVLVFQSPAKLLSLFVHLLQLLQTMLCFSFVIFHPAQFQVHFGQSGTKSFPLELTMLYLLFLEITCNFYVAPINGELVKPFPRSFGAVLCIVGSIHVCQVRAAPSRALFPPTLGEVCSTPFARFPSLLSRFSVKTLTIIIWYLS